MPTENATAVSFDDSPSWPAAVVGRWNGWAVPRVTAEVREQIAAWLDEQPESSDTAAEVRALPATDGFVVIDCGLTFWSE